MRAKLSAFWVHRARSERRVGCAFALMIPRLVDVGASDIVVDLLRAASAEEAQHADLCMEMAAHYAATTPAPVPAIANVVLPSFGFDDPVMENAVLVASMCCINESIACVWLEACLRVASAPIAVAANRLHLREEVNHARLGWAHLASYAVPEHVRRDIGGIVAALVRANRPLWDEPPSQVPVEGVAEHGCLSHQHHREVIEHAISAVNPFGESRGDGAYHRA